MEEIKSEILADAKMLLGLTGNEHDEILLFLIEDSINSALAYCRLEILPRQLDGLVAQLVVKLFRTGDYGNSEALFKIKSMTEGERRIEFELSAPNEVFDDYHARLNPYRSRAARLPSELSGEDVLE